MIFGPVGQRPRRAARGHQRPRGTWSSALLAAAVLAHGPVARAVRST
ncbi:MAG: hypothetical protein MZV65_33880 [Chromatiales bacterium]|nr:hypothetical protein [Chromatiales bacterium]